MRCRKCSAINLSTFLGKEILCKKCEKYMQSLVYGVFEYSNLLYAMFIKPDIVDSDATFETCKTICDKLIEFEELGVKVLDDESCNHLSMFYRDNSILDLRDKLVEINDSIKERNIRISLFNLARQYETNYEFECARLEYMKLHNMYPSHINPILSVADMYRKLNELDKAINFLLKAKNTPYYNGTDSPCISYRHNLNKKLDDLMAKKDRGYKYYPRKK